MNYSSHLSALLILLIFMVWLPRFSVAAATECSPPAQPIEFSQASWGADLHNTRWYPDSSITPANVGQLELAWAFGLEGESPHSYPIVSRDTLYIGDGDGTLYALARDSGCIRWQFDADDEIRTAIVAGKVGKSVGNVAGKVAREVAGDPSAASVMVLFFGTLEGTAYAVRADNGQLLWQHETDPHPFATVTGTPVFHNNVLYVPVSSYEVVVAALPFYGCCTFRGSVVALDAGSGTPIWQTYTVESEARPLTSNWLWPDKKGPSGAPVWSSPTLDLKRQQLIFGSGENYSDPPTDTSDAITALDMHTGELIWRRQFTEGDTWNGGCGWWFDSNCPEANGPDLDFGAPPILVEDVVQDHVVLGDIVLAGQKSANVFAMQADTGELLWERRLGRGGMLGGIHWGMAAHAQHNLLLVPISDRATGDNPGEPQPGIYALGIIDGATRWQYQHNNNCTPAKEQCHPGMSAAIALNNTLVFAGSLDGGLYAFDLHTGKMIWQSDTWRNYPTINGKAANGAAIDVHGPLLVDDLLILSSGYAGFGQGGGNALLVYHVPDD